MNRDLEQQILDLARERGLIGEADLENSVGANDVVRRWGSRLGVLVSSGALAEEDLVGLVGELTGGLHSEDGEAPEDESSSGDDERVSSEARTNVYWHPDGGGGGSTATLEVSGRWSTSGGSGFPVADWERYEIVDFLGAGGMGRVYKAWDPRLKRHVALKFISRNDPEVVQRFFREAQSQAQVEHPNVCRINEVGEVDGQPYIAMQYIKGKPIHEVREQLTLDERVVALARIADAVHAAHRTGLIHRDIKPSNILVGRAEEGGWTPTVLDFGLARQMEGEGLTMTGALMGTPSYMAPEQARGEVERLDRRTDVYGLGATLYLLLSGVPPYQGDNQLEILLKAADGEPKPLATLDPTLPADLCNITTRAMEREPQRRYESARAMAEDLRRYLDGEPVLARPQSVGYKLGKWVKRNRRMVAVASVALIAVTVALGLLVHQRWTAAEQQRMAQRFSQEAAQIESVMWKARAVPAHDTRPQKELVRAQMQQIEADMTRLGRNAEGPGHHALGSAHLALFEPREARDHLQQAWDAGYQTPEVAYGLALALGEIYQVERTTVESLYSKSERERALADVAAAYRDPAVEWLRRSEESEYVAPDLARALIANHEERFDDALSAAARALEGRPWLYEAWILQGQVYSRLGLQQSLGGDKQAALQSFELGERALLEAERIAPSDVRIQEKLAHLYARRYTHKLLGAQSSDDRDRLLAAVDRGVEIDPERVRLQSLRCYAYEIKARGEYADGEDPGDAIAESIRAGEAALEMDPGDVYARQQLGSAYSHQAFLLGIRGEDGGPAARRAVAVLEEALTIYPTYFLHVELAIAHQHVARCEMNHGRDPLASLDHAEGYARQALELKPDRSHPRLVLSEVLSFKGSVVSVRGGDPTILLQDALAALEIQRENDPFEGWFTNWAGWIRIDMARYQMSIGQDPRETLAEALRDQERTEAIRPGAPAPRELYTEVLRARAEYEAWHGVDPGETLDECIAAADQVLEMQPGLGVVHYDAGAALVLRATHAWHTGRDPDADLDRAMNSFEAGIEVSPGLAVQGYEPLLGYSLWARVEQGRGRTPMTTVEEGMAYADHFLAVNAIHPDVWRERADLLLSRARWELSSGGNPSASFLEAENSLVTASATNPRDARALLLEGEIAYWRASWRVRQQESLPTEEIEVGLDRVDQALEIKPDLADALVLRGRLHLLIARAGEDELTRRTAAAAARDALSAAVGINGHLAWSVRGDLSEATRLAR